jgi:hypothetical protein
MRTENSANDKNKEISTCIVKKYFSMIIWYIIGVATPFIILGALYTLGVKSPKSKSEMLVDKWHIQECNGITLLVSMPIEPNVYFTMGMEYEPNTVLLKEIGITKGKNLIPEQSIFMYRTKGKYGVPAAYYGSPEQGVVWRDLNFDGHFDQRIDYQKKLMEIYVSCQWIKGLLRDKAVITDNGSFVFDPNNSRWKEIKSQEKQ